MQTWSFIGDAVTCNASIIHLDYYHDLNINSSNSSEVQLIQISNNSLTFIPSDSNKKFSNLIAIYLGSCSISYLDSFDLYFYENLQWLSLSNNLIEHIPEGFFSHTPHIKAIYFYGNRLKSVGESLLQPLKQLKFANFIDNSCINQFASTAAQIQGLINDLEENCKNETETTTSAASPTTTSTEASELEPTCGEGSIKDRICFLEIQNEFLLRKNENLRGQLDDINRKLDAISEGLFGFTQVQQAILMSLSLNDVNYENFPEILTEK